jgi:hypothetical protein
VVVLPVPPLGLAMTTTAILPPLMRSSRVGRGRQPALPGSRADRGANAGRRSPTIGVGRWRSTTRVNGCLREPSRRCAQGRSPSSLRGRAPDRATEHADDAPARQPCRATDRRGAALQGFGARSTLRARDGALEPPRRNLSRHTPSREGVRSRQRPIRHDDAAPRATVGGRPCWPRSTGAGRRSVPRPGGHGSRPTCASLNAGEGIADGESSRQRACAGGRELGPAAVIVVPTPMAWLRTRAHGEGATCG